MKILVPGGLGFIGSHIVEYHLNKKGEPISIYGDGSQTRSFGDVRDVVVALDLIAENISTRYNIRNVGVDHEIAIKALANLVRECANSKSDIIYVPYKKIYGMEFLDTMHRRPDLTKLHKLIHFKHKQTLEKTVDNLIGIFNENSLKPQLKNKNLQRRYFKYHYAKEVK